jgi:hypothetical protein
VSFTLTTFSLVWKWGVKLQEVLEYFSEEIQCIIIRQRWSTEREEKEAVVGEQEINWPTQESLTEIKEQMGFKRKKRPLCWILFSVQVKR